MATSTTARDLPQVSQTVEPAVRDPLGRVIEETQRLLGFRGDPLDAAITERRARAIGLVDGDGRPLVGDVTYNNTYPTTGGGGGDPPYEPDLTPPPTPTGFTGLAGFSFVNLEWDNPGYTQGHGHAQTNVYAVKRDASAPGTPPVFGDAQIVHVEYGTSPLTSVPSELNTRWHIWIKWKTIDGIESVAAAGGTNGLVLDTAQDVAQLLEVLSGQITESQLYAALGERITQINADAGMVIQKFWGFDSDYGGWDDGIAATLSLSGGMLEFVSTGSNPSIANTLPVGDRFPGANATIVRARVRRTAGSGAWEGNFYYRTDLAGAQPDAHTYSGSFRKNIAAPANPADWNVLEWDMGALTAGGTDWIDREIQGLRLDLVGTAGDTWEIDWIAVGETSVTPLTTAILQEQTIRENETGALEAQYTVKVDLNGYVAGYGLAATLNNATPTSQFIVRADQFAIAPPTNFTQESTPTTTTVGHLWRKPSTGAVKAWDGNSWEVFTNNLPFVVQTTRTVIDGVVVDPGTYIQAANIINLAAKYATIQTLVADDITAANISAAQITGGTMQVGSFIQSTNYTSGGAGNGWRINSDGTAFLQAGYIRGLLVASQINSSGLSVKTAAGVTILDAGTSNYTGNVSGTAAATLLATANTAATNASDALADAATANALVANISADDKVTPVEKRQIKLEFDNAAAEKAGINTQASGFGITTENTEYNNAYALMNAYVNSASSLTNAEGTVSAGNPFLANLTNTTDLNKTYTRAIGGAFTEGGGLRLVFVDFYAARQRLLNRIAAEAENGNIALAAVNNATTGLGARLLSGAADVLSGVISVNVVSGSAGFRAGNLVWNTSGVRTTGYGVAMTTNGLIGVNAAGQTTFALNATTGDLTLGGAASAASGYFAGSLVAADGEFNGTVKVGTAARSGNTMTGSGAIIEAGGNFSLGNATGNITRNGGEIILNGDVVATGNIIADGVTSLYTQSGTGGSVSVSVTVPTGFTYRIVGIGFQRSHDSPGSATLTLLGTTLNLVVGTYAFDMGDSSGTGSVLQAGTICAYADRAAGTHTITLAGQSGAFKNLVVLACKR